MKLWKVKVNNFGWNAPSVIYASSREEAEEIYRKYPAADRVEYAGNFAEPKAKRLLGKEEKEEF